MLFSSSQSKKSSPYVRTTYVRPSIRLTYQQLNCWSDFH